MAMTTSSSIRLNPIPLPVFCFTLIWTRQGVIIHGALTILDLLPRWPDALETACVQGEVALKEAAGKDDIAAAAKLFEKCLVLEPDICRRKRSWGSLTAASASWTKPNPSCGQAWTNGLLKKAFHRWAPGRVDIWPLVL